jgi:hypothetical protein
MGKRDKSYLVDSEYLKKGDYMVSNNGFFHVILQNDGNLCVYRGSGPSDNHGVLWHANKTTEKNVIAMKGELEFEYDFAIFFGTDPDHLDNNPNFIGRAPVRLWSTHELKNAVNFYAIIQDDGNFCIYEGNAPHDNPRPLWCAHSTDEVVNFEILSIDYDVAHSTIKETNPSDIYEQTVVNDLDIPQTSSIHGSRSVEEMSGWSDTLGIRIGLKTEFKTKIPIIADGKVELSVDVSNEYTWNGSTTHTHDWSFDTPITLQAHTKGKVVIIVSISTISVPYTMTGNHVHKSGTKIPGIVTGTYTGTNSHNQQVRFFKPAENGGFVPVSAEELQALLAPSTT